MFTRPRPNTVHQVLFTLNQPSRVTVVFIERLAILTQPSQVMVLFTDPKFRARVLFNSSVHKYYLLNPKGQKYCLSVLFTQLMWVMWTRFNKKVQPLAHLITYSITELVERRLP
jgi:hypothetical protein